jgi:hypothetical protein
MSNERTIQRGKKMPGPLYSFFEDDHRRLEELLNRATADPATYELLAYAQFRSRLLKHIKMEETILLSAAQKARGGEPLPIAAKIRLDHGALTALMVPPPSPVIVAAIRAILADHNRLEEGPGGLYEACEQLAGGEVHDLLAKARNIPDVPVLPHKSEPFVLEAIRRALARAGYNLDDYSKSDSLN